MQTKPMNTDELAELFGVSRRTVYNWINAGMPVLKPSPGVVRFDVAACTDWMRVNAPDAPV